MIIIETDYKDNIMKTKITVAAIIAAVILTACFVYKSNSNGGISDINYETQKAVLGSIVNSISATGTIEPISKVEISTQVSGIVKKVYVNYNDKVKRGQLIAEIDKTNLISTLKSEEISLKSAQNDYEYQQNSYRRSKELYDKKFSNEADIETAKYNLDNSEVKLEKAKLTYEKAEDNLGYASIYSPIDGVVLSVSIEEGQTVVSSFSAPTLFTIVNDLTKMEVQAGVDEADIGSVTTGQEVEFTIDAYPDKTFSGTVSQIRLEPTTSSNVVTYSVIINAPNPDGKLLPGMTASLNIFTLKLNDVLIIPEKALNFKPDLSSLPKPPDGNMRPAPGFKTGEELSDHVWIKEGDKIKPIKIKTGATDGTNREILEGLAENEEVILNAKTSSETDEAITEGSGSQKSPFMPGPPGRKK